LIYQLKKLGGFCDLFSKQSIFRNFSVSESTVKSMLFVVISAIAVALVFVIFELFFKKKETSPCQEKFSNCEAEQKQLIETYGTLPADMMPCEKCDENGLFVDTKWSHPLITSTYCIDKYTGKAIAGTDRDSSDLNQIDCNEIQR